MKQKRRLLRNRRELRGAASTDKSVKLFGTLGTRNNRELCGRGTRTILYGYVCVCTRLYFKRITCMGQYLFRSIQNAFSVVI